MTSVTGSPTQTGSAWQLLDSGRVRLQQASAEEIQEAFSKMEELKEGMLGQIRDLQQHPGYDDYARVVVDGEVVATVNNLGGYVSSNSLVSDLAEELAALSDGLTGPAAAQKRAELIAERLGGEVVMAETALTQADFDALPAPYLIPDAAALEAQLQQAKQAASEFRAQQIAQESEGEGNGVAALPAEEEEEESAAVQAFLDYMAKSPEERYFEAFLSSKGMTQEEYDALPADDKKALMKEFEAFVKQNMESNSAEKVARTSRSELL